MTEDLFSVWADGPSIQPLAAGAVVLPAFASADAQALWHLAQAVVAQAPFRAMATPGGLPMSVTMSSCGRLGWHSDRGGYRYVAQDPVSGQPWPPLPAGFLALAAAAAATAGYPGFVPDSCLLNRYLPGAAMGLHQDRDEAELGWPIVSVSLGLAAVFLFGGLRRRDKPVRVLLRHGDVVVWGGPSRLCYHGVAAVKPGCHPLLGGQRLNLTLRKAGATGP